MPYDLYVVTDREIGRGRTHQEIALEAAAGGADVIQFRDKTLLIREFIETAKEIRDITSASGAMFIVNDRIDAALAVGADGVHLGQNDMTADWARRISPPGFIIGISVGNVAEAIEAESAGADYVALSPVFSTVSKDDAGPGHGLEMLSRIRSNVDIPVIGIGGIGLHNVKDVLSAGADGIAVISAVAGADDIRSAAEEMKKIIAVEKRKNGLG
ncbi:thiamine-phosphate pyrophosphorylase [Methanolacinia petrolearia DSM 11571]|uniref:Thiamine-phosphate synthase n=1 Tax=Methanolacinia petrolearia (strain DSM 11571 / OCM 486 / SEBR 4847) TaxID=679926 RepID=E1RFA2_METP4|nr:thiamine phosphate synthase [Methanolacinia petrolearia]ADN35050.1 thiamine-phosphate pyrophosphorylase [Methanolacinia petrolearia DSM 11571]